jgi:hypothetical protein
MCPALGLGRSGAAGDRIGEVNFESHAVGEGTVVAGLRGPWRPRASRRCVRVGRGERERMMWRVVERMRRGLVRRPAAGGKGNLPVPAGVTLFPSFFVPARQR